MAAVCAAAPAQAPVSTTGTRQALVRFARFADDPAIPVPDWADSLFDSELPGSFSHYYDTMSLGRLRVRGEAAPRRYASRYGSAHYLPADPGQQGHFGEFVQEILAQADAEVDLARFDNEGPDGVPGSGDDDGTADMVFVLLDGVPSGFLVRAATGICRLGLERPWVSADGDPSGRRTMVSSGQGAILGAHTRAEAVGSMAHEYGHVLGLRDLFNYRFRPGSTPETDSAGAGAWCLMGWGATGWNGDDGPNSLCAYSRMQLGWAEVVEVSQPQRLVLEEVGRRGEVYQLPLQWDEYFLLEYRQRRSSHYDRQIPGEGLLIWHVKSSGVDLECADGRWQDAGYPLGHVPDPLNGEDNLDFWAHDAAYAQQHGGNLGDATDPFDGVRFPAFTPETNPAATSNDGTAEVRLEGSV